MAGIAIILINLFSINNSKLYEEFFIETLSDTQTILVNIVKTPSKLLRKLNEMT